MARRRGADCLSAYPRQAEELKNVSCEWPVLVLDVCLCVSQITMTTVWLLLLVVVSSQSVDGQSTTGDDVCNEEQSCASSDRYFEILLRHIKTLMSRLSKS